MRFFFLLLIIVQLAAPHLKAETAKQPVVDPVKSAKWLCSVFAIKEGKVLVAGKAPEKYFEARLPFAAKTEVRHYRDKWIIADQDECYPMIIGPTDDGYYMSMHTPFYAFLDEIIESDGLPGYAPHPKAAAMSLGGFRVISENLHEHFTKSTGSLPECFRVFDEILYPSEHYVWNAGTTWIILTAYDGNDSDGIYLTITSKSDSLEALRKMAKSPHEPFKDWGEPLPHLTK